MAGYIISVLNDPSTAGGTFAEGINDSGQVVGYYVDTGGHQHGFLYNGVTYTTLNYFYHQLNTTFSGVDTVARDINDAGVIVGYTNVGMNLGTTFPPSNIGGYTYSNGVFSLPISTIN